MLLLLLIILISLLGDFLEKSNADWLKYSTLIICSISSQKSLTYFGVFKNILNKNVFELKFSIEKKLNEIK